jgi:multidrug efflux system outer membrane protein
MKRSALVLVALLFPLASGVAQQAAPVLSLQQAIDAALSSGDDNKILTGNLEVARAQHALNVSKDSFTLAGSAGYGQAVLLGDPTLQKKLEIVSGPNAGLVLAGPLTSVAVSASPFSVAAGSYPGASTTPAAATLGVSVSQTLWNGYPGGPAKAVVDKSALTLQGKEASTDAGRLTLVYSIKQTYYAMLAAQRNLALQSKILVNQNALLKQIQAVYGIKQASLVDLKTAQVNARSAQVSVDSARNDLHNAQVALATLMGASPDQDFTVADAPDPTLPVSTVDDAVGQALARRVELKQLELSIRSGNVDLAVARGLAQPSVSVTGGLNMAALWGQPPTNAYQVTAGVKVAMPILNAGAARNQADVAAQQNAVYAIQEAQLRKSITTAVRSAWALWQLAVEKLQLARDQADVAALLLEIYKTEFDNGTASNQDFLTQTVTDASAQTAVLAANSGVQLALFQLLNVMGY